MNIFSIEEEHVSKTQNGINITMSNKLKIKNFSAYDSKSYKIISFILLKIISIV